MRYLKEVKAIHVSLVVQPSSADNPIATYEEILAVLSFFERLKAFSVHIGFVVSELSSSEMARIKRELGRLRSASFKDGQMARRSHKDRELHYAWRALAHIKPKFC